MNLAHILEALELRRVEGSPDREIRSICYDSRLAGPGALFVALRGEKTDGHHHVAQAVERGAVAVLCEEEIPAGKATRIEVADTRVALALAAGALYGAPSRKLKVCGITGTNGKTTTSFLLKHLFESSRHRCGLIGTVRYEIADRILPALRTTPESADLHALMAEMFAAGCRAVAMEVSSHALQQHRVDGIEFDVSIFTNLSQDHLDYHGTMQQYFEAKSLLFKLQPGSKKTPKAIINSDDPYGAKLITRIGKELPVITYGMGARAEFRAADVRQTLQCMTFSLEVRGKGFLVRLPLMGRFNVYNALAALAAAHAVGLDLRTCVQALAEAPQVPGRMQLVAPRRKPAVYVDYAHTPDALLNVLRTLRDLNLHRIITVFGCGGNRDRTKRPVMGKIADTNSDFCVLTSDNPRDENPEAILRDVAAGFSSPNRFEIHPDRTEAIHRAVSLAGPDDVVLIAGKGHEAYQETAGNKTPFDDSEVALQALNARPVEHRT